MRIGLLRRPRPLGGGGSRTSISAAASAAPGLCTPPAPFEQVSTSVINFFFSPFLHLKVLVLLMKKSEL